MPGARVVERAHAEHALAGVRERAEGVRFCHRLAARVGRHRPEWRVLRERHRGLVDDAVLLGAADDEHTVHVRGTARGEHVRGSFDVDAEDLVLGVERLADVAGRGQVVHNVRAQCTEAFHEPVDVGHVDRVGTGAVERGDVVAH